MKPNKDTERTNKLKKRELYSSFDEELEELINNNKQYNIILSCRTPTVDDSPMKNACWINVEEYRAFKYTDKWEEIMSKSEDNR